MPGLESPEAVSFESRRHGRFSQHSAIAFLGFSRRDAGGEIRGPSIAIEIRFRTAPGRNYGSIGVLNRR